MYLLLRQTPRTVSPYVGDSRTAWLAPVRWLAARLGSTHLQARAAQCVRVQCSGWRGLAKGSVSPRPYTNHANPQPKPAKEIPGPRILPFVGTVHSYLPIVGDYDPKRLMEAALAQYHRYGSIVRMKIMRSDVSYLLFDPNDIEKVYRSEGKTPVKSSIRGFVKYRKERNSGLGLFNSNHDEWLRLRHATNIHMMRPRAAANYIPVQTSVSRDLVRLMRTLRDQQGEVPDYLSILYRWALESSGLVIFNERLEALERELPTTVEQFVNVVKEIFTTIQILQYERRQKRSKIQERFNKAADYVASVAEKYMDLCLKKMETEGNMTGVLPGLLREEELSRDDVIVILFDLLVASIDTSAHSLGFVLYELAKHPEVQEKLHEEITQVAPPGTDVTADIGNELRYLRAVLKETYRLNPVIGMVVRVLEKDLVLSGYLVPAGTRVIPIFYVPSRLPEYFDNTEQFLPERWLRENVKALHPYSVLPFSTGPRSCIGKRFAEQSIHLALLQIVQNFRVEYHHEDIGLMTRMINMPDKPLRFSFVDRT